MYMYQYFNATPSFHSSFSEITAGSQLPMAPSILLWKTEQDTLISVFLLLMLFWKADPQTWNLWRNESEWPSLTKKKKKMYWQKGDGEMQHMGYNIVADSCHDAIHSPNLCIVLNFEHKYIASHHCSYRSTVSLTMFNQMRLFITSKNKKGSLYIYTSYFKYNSETSLEWSYQKADSTECVQWTNFYVQSSTFNLRCLRCSVTWQLGTSAVVTNLLAE